MEKTQLSQKSNPLKVMLHALFIIYFAFASKNNKFNPSLPFGKIYIKIFSFDFVSKEGFLLGFFRWILLIYRSCP